MKKSNEQFQSSKVRLMIINEDGQNRFIDGFTKYMESYATFVEPVEGEEAIKDALFFRRAEYILTIPKGFTDHFLENENVTLKKQMIPDSVEAISIDRAINNYLNMAKVYLKHMPEVNMDEVQDYIKLNLEQEVDVTFLTKMKEADTSSNEFNKFYFNFLAYIMISIFITGVSIVMHSYHGLDIRRKHAASPLSNRNMNIQLIIANIIFILSYLVIFIIAGFVLNKERVLNMSMLLVWLNAVVFGLAAFSMSYLVGITVKSRKAISAIATALSLIMAFLSGIFVPQEFLGASVLKIASFTPSYWYVKANLVLEKLTTYEWSAVSEVYGYMAIQLGFAAAIISVAMVISKRKRQQAI
jgi:ABC-2 type transport system permease protein